MRLKVQGIFLAIVFAGAIGSCKKKMDGDDMANGGKAEVFIISPEDGAEVSGPVTIKFGAKNVEIVPAGTNKENSGHHHLFIDTDEMPEMGAAIPKDEHHMHFGKGQTEATIELKPGKHTLQLVLGDKDHIPFHPQVMSKKITITVK